MDSIITISGNIGCGKTTIIDYLTNLYKDNAFFKIFKEPIDSWGSWLDLFYTNPEKYAFPFQMKVLIDFLYLNNISDKDCIITERSPLDSLHVFTKTLKNDDKITYLEYNLYQEYVNKIGWKPKHIIYIQTNPNNCIQRIKKRMRGCESGIDESYIQSIHTIYEQWIDSIKNNHESNINVHIINGNQEKEIVFENVKKVISEIKDNQ